VLVGVHDPDDIEIRLYASARNCAALLEALGIDRAHVVGRSSGCTVAMQLAVGHPQLAADLVLSEPPVDAGADRSRGPAGCRRHAGSGHRQRRRSRATRRRTTPS
jgi:pimeloyl-ACP methyl ester carboxylesterase